MLNAVHYESVVNFVGEDEKVVVTGNLNNVLKNLLRVNSTRRVVRVNDYDSLCLGSYLASHIVDIGIPVVFLVTFIENGLAAGDIGRVRPKRIARGGHENLVALIKERKKSHENKLTYAVTDIYVVGCDSLNALALMIVANCLTCIGHTLKVAICNGSVGIVEECIFYAVGHSKAECGRVACVKTKHLDAFLVHSLAFKIKRTSDVGMNRL